MLIHWQNLLSEAKEMAKWIEMWLIGCEKKIGASRKKVIK